MPPVSTLRAFLLADVDVGQDLLELIVRRLSADLRAHVERIALLDLLDALDRALHEPIVDRLLDQRALRARAHLALVEREHREAFERLVEEVIVVAHHVGEEDVRRLAAELERHRDDVLRCILHDEPAGRRLAGEGDLGDARLDASGLPASRPKPLTMFSTPGGRMSRISSANTSSDSGVCSAGLMHDAIARGERRAPISRPPSASGNSRE